MTEPRRLPPFPTDPGTLALLRVAVNPWANGVEADHSSVASFLEFMSQLGGSDTGQVEEELDDGIAVMAHPQYSPNDVIEALVDEIERLRTDPDDSGSETLGELKDRIGWHASLNDVMFLVIVVTGIIAVVVNSR